MRIYFFVYKYKQIIFSYSISFSFLSSIILYQISQLLFSRSGAQQFPAYLVLTNNLSSKLWRQTVKLKELYEIAFTSLHKETNPLKNSVPVRQPFGTILHNDMWCNNTMQRFLDGRAIENKFLDFQNYQYGSPVRDLIFFLWSSCQFEVLKVHYEDLVRHYHHHFLQTLRSLGCDVEPFSFVKFMEEMKRNAQCEALHAMSFMTIIVFGRKRADTEDVTPPFNVTKEEVPTEAKRRIWLLISSYGKLGWL